MVLAGMRFSGKKCARTLGIVSASTISIRMGLDSKSAMGVSTHSNLMALEVKVPVIVSITIQKLTSTLDHRPSKSGGQQDPGIFG